MIARGPDSKGNAFSLDGLDDRLRAERALLQPAASGHGGRAAILSSLRQVGNRDLESPLRRPFPGTQLMHRVEDVSAVVSIPAGVADPDLDILQDDEALLVLEALHHHRLGANGPCTIVAPVSVHGLTLPHRQ